MRIAIIGAGATGLSAAYDLARAGHAVSVFEAGDRVGGLAAGFKADHWDWTLEKFYHHWFSSDRDILGLIDELGARDRVVFPRPVTVVYYQGKFYPFDSPQRWLSFPGFSWLDVVRFGAIGAYFKALPNGVRLERYTADAWLRRWMGQRAYDLIWRPLLVGKFGERYYRDINLAWLWARIKSRTPAPGQLPGRLPGLSRSARRARPPAAARTIALNSPISGGHAARPAAASRWPRRAARRHSISASPPPHRACWRASRRSCRRPTAISCTSLKSLGAVVMVLALNRQLTDYYWFNLPKEAGFPFLALVEHTNFLPREHYGGDHLIYCGDYLEPDHEYFRSRTEALLERFLPSLSRFNPAFDRSWVKQTWLWRTEYAQPVPLVNHSQQHPRDQDAARRPVARQHEPGLPVGSRHQLRRAARPPRGGDGHGAERLTSALPVARRLVRWSTVADGTTDNGAGHRPGRALGAAPLPVFFERQPAARRCRPAPRRGTPIPRRATLVAETRPPSSSTKRLTM